ncbi:hypothetical protein ACHHYP_13967 [Achlya hypogyna]|uniref:Protein HGH1 C-terminal domain-containing protein n=1 Tax=Achlya hypogyna TaxID=1202772 RepID=A0A1V9YEB8_ACHHY|nr:hypothetical protein ACHHYP_13967 [Achlya hypogyna]
MRQSLTPPKALVEVLLPQIHSPNVVRRRGIVQAVRNLCFDSDNQYFLYDTLDVKNGMTNLVLGCLGAKKKRETDVAVRQAAMVHPIVRNAHLVEANDEVSDQIYKLVDFLIRDEEGEEPDWDEIRAKSLGVSKDAEPAAAVPAHEFESVLDKPLPPKPVAPLVDVVVRACECTCDV